MGDAPSDEKRQPHPGRISHWVLTGDHGFGHDADGPKKRCEDSSPVHTSADGSVDDDPGPEAHTSLSSSPSSANGPLLGRDNDLLIPEPAAINRTAQAARRTWQGFVCRAEAMPATHMPRGTCDPSILLRDVPALPPHSTAVSLDGMPLWRRFIGGDNGAEETLCHGLAKQVVVLAPKPLVCRLTLAADDTTHRPPHSVVKGLAILTLCWSYIVSTRLLELQGRAATYTKAGLLVRPAAGYIPHANEYALDLQGVSYGLVRWLCAVLAPRPGWHVSQPPAWMARASADVCLVVLHEKPIRFISGERPPTAAEAADLLIELCKLFALHGRGSLHRRGRPAENDPSEPLPAYTAAFFAALALPLYHDQKWEPHLALTPLTRMRSKPPRASVSRQPATATATATATTTTIRQYVADLPYYMTLSADRAGRGSRLWSMFWQPDVVCSLVSPWLAGTLYALRPLIDAGDVSTLEKALALRRPRVAPWWLGALFLGDRAVREQMVLWLETTKGTRGRGLAATSAPDITGAAWTGAANSFWELDDDDTAPGARVCYPRETDLVPRADVLRCRQNCQLQNSFWETGPCWRPSGHIRKAHVELDLWPLLEQGFTRQYAHWEWRIDNQTIPTDPGFRRDTGRFVSIHDDFAIHESDDGEDPPPPDMVVLKRPSIIAVGRMLDCCMTNVLGEVNEDNADLPGLVNHKWQRHWNILPSGWQ